MRRASILAALLLTGCATAVQGPPAVSCNSRFIDDDKVTPRPIRLFHGIADDYTPVAPCRAWVGR